MAGGNGMKIGLSLGDREVTGVVLGKKGAPVARSALPVSLEDPEGGAGLRKALLDVKLELEKRAGDTTDGATVHVALSPPLADARLVTLPPLRKKEIQVVLERDVGRYFLGGNGPRVVAARLPGRGTASQGSPEAPSPPVLAAAAPLATLEMTRHAIKGLGWRPGSFSASHMIWLEVGRAVKGDPVTSIVAAVGNVLHLVLLDGSDPAGVRQVSVSDPEALVKALVGGTGPVLVLADGPTCQELSTSLIRIGRTPVRDPDGWQGAAESAAARASSSGYELVTPAVARERKDRGRKTTLALAGSALVLIILSLGAQLWGAQRELAALQERRSSIRAEVTPLLQIRDSLSELNTRVASLEELSRNSPAWTRSLVELAALLPRDTYLTGLFASGDTVEIEAAGSETAEAIQTLRQAGLFEEVRLQGLVERELEEGETVVERFRLWGFLPRGSREGGGS